MEADDHMMSLYKQMKDNDRLIKQEAAPDPDTKAKAFREKIERMMQDYRKYCADMQMETWLNEYGNQDYHLEKQKNPKRLHKNIVVIKDPGLTSRFFDVLTWWKVRIRTYIDGLQIANTM